jgi:hypothetical protein
MTTDFICRLKLEGWHAGRPAARLRPLCPPGTRVTRPLGRVTRAAGTNSWQHAARATGRSTNRPLACS